MKNSFIKGFKSWNDGFKSSDCPYREGFDKRHAHWIKGFISAHAENILKSKNVRRIPKSF